MKPLPIIITVIVIAVFTAASVARAARPLQVRMHWLDHRADYHRYICRHGRNANRRFHCAALKWTHRELLQARAEKHARWLRLPDTNDWQTAVKIAQRVYPGTDAWLLSCSRGEGGHGRWVRYGGGSYYPGYERTDAVGGWLQFRPSTYYAYVYTAISYARHHGFTVPAAARSWLSPLGQALTGGYMRKIAGNSHWHWQASIDRGCA